MKSSCHTLIPLLPLFCSWQFQRLDSIQSQVHIPAGWRLEIQLYSTAVLSSRTLTYNHFPWTPRKTQLLLFKELCLLIRCSAIDVLFLSEFACAGECLPSPWLALSIHITMLLQKGCLIPGTPIFH
jgi:hypothetical protein